MRSRRGRLRAARPGHRRARWRVATTPIGNFPAACTVSGTTAVNINGPPRRPTRRHQPAGASGLAARNINQAHPAPEGSGPDRLRHRARTLMDSCGAPGHGRFEAGLLGGDDGARVRDRRPPTCRLQARAVARRLGECVGAARRRPGEGRCAVDCGGLSRGLRLGQRTRSRAAGWLPRGRRSEFGSPAQEQHGYRYSTTDTPISGNFARCGQPDHLDRAPRSADPDPPGAPDPASVTPDSNRALPTPGPPVPSRVRSGIPAPNQEPTTAGPASRSATFPDASTT